MIKRSLLALSLMALAGCTLATAEDLDEAIETHEVEETSLALVRAVSVPRALWQTAEVGCEGKLRDPRITIAEAEGEPELGVVLLGGTRIVCVDTRQSLRDEAGTTTLPGISLAYIKTVAADPSPQPSEPQSADPSPQPSTPLPDAPTSADPSPQPSAPLPEGGDPSPQPSDTSEEEG